MKKKYQKRLVSNSALTAPMVIDVLSSRRQFLQYSAATLVLGSLALDSRHLHASTEQSPYLLSARSDVYGQHFCSGYGLDGRVLFNTPVPQRCHDVLPHPFLPRVVCCARRPGTHVYLLDSSSGRVLQTLQARAHRHFYGHGLFDAEGDRLYFVENDTQQPGKGIVGVYRLQDTHLVFEREFFSHGIEPHQFVWLLDRSGFAIANGGVRTEANSWEAMNDVVESSLVIVNLDGSLRQRDTLLDPRASIRHVALAADGTIVTGQQYIFQTGKTMEEGYEPANGGSLIAIKRPGQMLKLFPLAPEQLRDVNYYSASITVHDGLRWLAASAPRGHRLQVWDLDSGSCLLDHHLPDCAGIVSVANGFVASSGQQGCVQVFAQDSRMIVRALPLPAGGWDNHLNKVNSGGYA